MAICSTVRSYSKNSERNGASKKNDSRRRIITVRRRPGTISQGLLDTGHGVFVCALGRGGISAFKREGDGATPLASMRLLGAYYRHEGLLSHAGLRSRLPLRRIRPDDGWCDAPADRNYNRPVKLPYPAGHERMMRDDRIYDVCIVLDWNIRPRRRKAGSAIFMHIAKPGFSPTEGCVAVAPRVMARLLPYLSRRTVLRVLC